jgi:hypothetical protein
MPVPRDDEAKIIDFVVPTWHEVLEMLAARYSRDDLIANLEAYIGRGVDEVQWAVSKAEAGDEFVDFVLRRLFRNMIDAGEMPGATLRAYGLTPERKHKRGPRSDYGTWLRKLNLTIMIVWVSELFGLTPTREQASRHMLPPSGCSIMKAVLERGGDHKAESTVQNIYLEIIRIWDAEEGGLRGYMRADLDRLWRNLDSRN